MRALSSTTSAQIGRLLLNHLMAEHYMDACLACVADEDVDWEGAQLSFAQKLSLLGGKGGVLAEMGLLPGLRRLNRIRNQAARDLTAQLTSVDVAPMSQHLARHLKKSSLVLPADPVKIVDTFTAVACASMLGVVAGFLGAKHLTRATAGAKYADG